MWKNYDRDYYLMTICIEIFDAKTNLYLQVTHPNENNNEQQQANYNKIIEIIEKVGCKNIWEKNGICWYNIIEKSINNSLIENDIKENKEFKAQLNILIEKYNEIIVNFIKNN